MPTREEVFDAINTEREYQDRQWPDMSVGPRHSIGEDVLLLEQLVREATAEWKNEPKPEVKTLHHIRKIAGVAVRCMEAHGAPKRS